MDLLWRNKAERGVVDREIADQRRQAQVRRQLVGVIVGGDLLNVYRRRKVVERKVTRVDDADAIVRQEPQLSIRRLGDARAVGADARMAPDSVRAVEKRDLDRPLRIGDPRVQVAACDAHEAAGHVQPERMRLVFDDPIDGIAGQPVLAGNRRRMTVLQPAQTGLRRDPERTVPIELKTVDATRPQPIGICERRAQLAILEIGQAALGKS